MAFLPVFYSHLALNDVPTLAPLCLALWGAAGVLRDGRGAGLRSSRASASASPRATKYTGGIVLLPLLRAAFGVAPAARAARRCAGSLLAGVVALAAFFVANPYAMLDTTRSSTG